MCGPWLISLAFAMCVRGSLFFIRLSLVGFFMMYPELRQSEMLILIVLHLSSQLIDEQVLCVHGGLSPDIKTLDQIRTIERNQEIPHKGAFCDLVWSDPEDVDTWAISPRGAGWLFGSKVTNEVCLMVFE